MKKTPNLLTVCLKRKLAVTVQCLTIRLKAGKRLTI